MGEKTDQAFQDVLNVVRKITQRRTSGRAAEDLVEQLVDADIRLIHAVALEETGEESATASAAADVAVGQEPVRIEDVRALLEQRAAAAAPTDPTSSSEAAPAVDPTPAAPETAAEPPTSDELREELERRATMTRETA